MKNDNMRSSSKLIAPSILSADFSKLDREIVDVVNAGADWLHVDVMDGHFVPNLTIGSCVVKAIRPVSDIFFDVHLMIENPQKYIPDFAKAGADLITFHIESKGDPSATISIIRDHGKKVGITLRPKTPLSEIEPFLADVDLVLVMTVEPGFGGQSFMMDQVTKMESLYNIRQNKGYQYLIEVDGGVNDKTAKHCRWADVLVAGSFVFNRDYGEAISTLKSEVSS